MALFPVEFNSDEWQNFEAKLKAYASVEVLRLYQLWEATLSHWSWMYSACIIHNDDAKKRRQFEEKLQKAIETCDVARRLLLTQIRAELRHEPTAVSANIHIVQSELGGVAEIRTDHPALQSRDSDPYTRGSYITGVRMVPDGWAFTMVHETAIVSLDPTETPAAKLLAD